MAVEETLVLLTKPSQKRHHLAEVDLSLRRPWCRSNGTYTEPHSSPVFLSSLGASQNLCGHDGCILSGLCGRTLGSLGRRALGGLFECVLSRFGGHALASRQGWPGAFSAHSVGVLSPGSAQASKGKFPVDQASLAGSNRLDGVCRQMWLQCCSGGEPGYHEGLR